MIFASDTRLLAVAGIVYALAAAAILCQVVFATQPLQSSATKKDRRADVALVEHRMDTRVGACLLLFGFFLQALGTMGTSTLDGPAALLLLALAFGLTIYGLMKSSIAESYVPAHAHVEIEAPVAQPVADPVMVEPANNLVELRPIKVVDSAG